MGGMADKDERGYEYEQPHPKVGGAKRDLLLEIAKRDPVMAIYNALRGFETHDEYGALQFNDNDSGLSREWGWFPALCQRAMSPAARARAGERHGAPVNGPATRKAGRACSEQQLCGAQPQLPSPKQSRQRARTRSNTNFASDTRSDRREETHARAVAKANQRRTRLADRARKQRQRALSP